MTIIVPQEHNVRCYLHEHLAPLSASSSTPVSPDLQEFYWKTQRWGTKTPASEGAASRRLQTLRRDRDGRFCIPAGSSRVLRVVFWEMKWARGAGLCPRLDATAHGDSAMLEKSSGEVCDTKGICGGAKQTGREGKGHIPRRLQTKMQPTREDLNKLMSTSASSRNRRTKESQRQWEEDWREEKPNYLHAARAGGQTQLDKENSAKCPKKRREVPRNVGKAVDPKAPGLREVSEGREEALEVHFKGATVRLFITASLEGTTRMPDRGRKRRPSSVIQGTDHPIEWFSSRVIPYGWPYTIFNGISRLRWLARTPEWYRTNNKYIREFGTCFGSSKQVRKNPFTTPAYELLTPPAFVFLSSDLCGSKTSDVLKDADKKLRARFKGEDISNLL
ncbi:hypothetical protein K438DRAFT_2064348 [Mycena galopus ATCC 62051]|nr:hypothetical protein K438DRAFT_2064348 [Mycena galopus ATCC 62051]